MSSIKNSPILYMGNKSRLIRKGLINLFPKNISVFIDVFSGSASVAMNTKASKYVINDIDDVLQSYYKMFVEYDEKFLIDFIKSRVQNFELPQKTTIRCFSDSNEVAKYKEKYHTYRDFYNKNKNPLDLYTLMFFAFSQQFRVNKKGDFNMPFGNNHFSQKNEQSIVEGHTFFKSKNVEFNNLDFADLLEYCQSNSELLNEDSFVYFDPPYSITTASYNENMAWTKADDERLFRVCVELNKKGFKFGLSNVVVNKGVRNDNLVDFCKANQFIVYSPNNFQYHACGLPNTKQQEVFICNYEPQNTISGFNKIHL